MGVVLWANSFNLWVVAAAMTTRIGTGAGVDIDDDFFFGMSYGRA